MLHNLAGTYDEIGKTQLYLQALMNCIINCGRTRSGFFCETNESQFCKYYFIAQTLEKQGLFGDRTEEESFSDDDSEISEILFQRVIGMLPENQRNDGRDHANYDPGQSLSKGLQIGSLVRMLH